MLLFFWGLLLRSIVTFWMMRSFDKTGGSSGEGFSLQQFDLQKYAGQKWNQLPVIACRKGWVVIKKCHHILMCHEKQLYKNVMKSSWCHHEQCQWSTKKKIRKIFDDIWVCVVHVLSQPYLSRWLANDHFSRQDVMRAWRWSSLRMPAPWWAVFGWRPGDTPKR